MFCYMHRPSHTPGPDHPQLGEGHDETLHRESFFSPQLLLFPWHKYLPQLTVLEYFVLSSRQCL